MTKRREIPSTVLIEDTIELINRDYSCVTLPMLFAMLHWQYGYSIYAIASATGSRFQRVKSAVDSLARNYAHVVK